MLGNGNYFIVFANTCNLVSSLDPVGVSRVWVDCDVTHRIPTVCEGELYVPHV